jgi:hypothetical protein
VSQKFVQPFHAGIVLCAAANDESPQRQQGSPCWRCTAIPGFRRATRGFPSQIVITITQAVSAPPGPIKDPILVSYPSTTNVLGGSQFIVEFDAGSRRDLLVQCNLSAITAGSVTFALQTLGPDGVWYQVAASSALSSAGTYIASVGRSLTNTVLFTNLCRLVATMVTGPATFSMTVIGKLPVTV